MTSAQIVQAKSINAGDTVMYSSIQDFIVDVMAEADSPCHNATTADSPAWYGTANFQVAIDLWKNGWQYGAEIAATYAEKFQAILEQNIVESSMYLDVTTQYCWDISSVVAGVPQCGINFQPDEEKKLVKLGINIGARGSVSPRVLLRRAAGMAALTQILAAHNYAIEITLVNVAHFDTSTPVALFINLHSPGEVLDIASLAFAMGHPSFFRRFVFQWRDYAISYATFAKSERKRFGGNSISYSGKEFDLYLDYAGENDYNWMSDTAACNWIKKVLAAQGIQFND